MTRFVIQKSERRTYKNIFGQHRTKMFYWYWNEYFNRWVPLESTATKYASIVEARSIARQLEGNVVVTSTN